MGGAHAVAALAYGTESVPRADVIAGPGSLYVQEAKRLVSRRRRHRRLRRPQRRARRSPTAGADAERWSRSTSLAQAEHGPGHDRAAPSATTRRCSTRRARVDAGWAGTGAVAALVDAPDLEAALAFAEAFAPEHLELVGAAAEALAPRVRSAGCVFVGRESATAFGDYVAGSNHTLPTGGAARFASGLSARATSAGA